MEVTMDWTIGSEKKLLQDVVDIMGDQALKWRKDTVIKTRNLTLRSTFSSTYNRYLFAVNVRFSQIHHIIPIPYVI